MTLSLWRSVRAGGIAPLPGLGVLTVLASTLLIAQPPSTPAMDDPALVVERAEQSYEAQPGEVEVVFTFRLRNVSPQPVVIMDVKTSCGCTVARMPSRPWIVPPGKTDELKLAFDMRGRTGLQTKTATVETERGRRMLTMNIRIPAAPSMAADPGARERNQALAKADRQAVFRGDCASCHVTPTIGLSGGELYKAACGICHEAEHRASFVPLLKELQRPADRDYWRTMVVAGKPGTLMPGFSADLGGPLNRPQIDSLVEYLIATYAVRN